MEEEQLERLIRKRGAMRGATTKLLQSFNTELNEDNVDVGRLRELLANLSVKEETLLDLDRGIEQGIATDDLEAEITNTEEYKERVITMRSRAQRVIQASDSVSSPRRFAGERTPTQNSVKLPKLTIQKFCGDVSLWRDFWNQFETAIHKNETLSKTERFIYLKSYLTGAAAKTVAGLMLTERNYDHALELLRDRYGRKDIVVNMHMTKLLNLTPVKRASDVVALRELYDECEIQIRSLESLGVVSETYGSLLCPILLQLIPEEIALQYSRQRGASDEWQVMEVMEFLQNEILSRERTMQLTRGNKERDYQSHHKPFKRTDTTFELKQRRQSLPSAVALYTSSQRTQNCVFCDSAEHKPEHCPSHNVTERRDILKRMGRCYVCLGQRHIARNCRIKDASCCQCGKRHHSAVCVNGAEPTLITSDKVEDVVSSFATQSMKVRRKGHSTVLLQTAQAHAVGPGGQTVVRCLLDGGSQRSFVCEKQSRALKLPVIRQETFTLHTFGSAAPVTTKRNTVKLVLENLWNKGQKIEIEAIEIPQVCTAVMKVPGEQIQRELKRRRLQFADAVDDGADDRELSVLIGADYYWSTVSGRVERLTDTLVALESVFGWSVQGPVTMSSVTEATCMHIRIEEDTLISSQLKAFWEIESLGITKEEPSDPDEEEALQRFENTTQFKNGRYAVELPWRHEKPELPDNYRIAKRRFEGLKRRLRADVVFYQRYNEVMEDYLQQGIVEEVIEGECSTSNLKYYLPHHAVLREDKLTTKMRVVFDASSHEAGCPSLNNCLLTGPNLNPDLLGILIRFRLHEIAFMADIKKAFLQISLAEKDRDAVRFLWLTAPPQEDTGEKLRVLRMTRVVFGVSPSPFLLAATVRKHLQQYGEQHTAQLIKESLYVDDFVASVRDVEEAVSVTTEAKDIMAAAGMDLCKWMTNSAALKERWKETLIGPTEEPEAHGTVLKVLGLVWRTQTDDFVFDFRPLLKKLTKNSTKRSVLQHSASIFDPLGFLTPFTIRVKCLLQEMWERGLSWDEELPADLNQQWNSWRSELPLIHQISIPRWYGKKDEQRGKTSRLHVFCDASEKAYSAVAYLQWEEKDGKMAVSLVASKSRVAPLKKLSLPRLELMGTLIGARLGRNLINLLKMETHQLHMWTDSMIVLHWIRGSTHKWKQFVANRVTEIQTLTDPASWSHCKGKENPADLPTRGQTVVSLSQSHLWWKGPAFLTSSEQEEESDDQSVEDDVAEEEIKVREHLTVQLATEEHEAVEQVLDLQRYSKLKTVLRITAWIKRFTDNTRSTTKRSGELTAEELLQAEKYWIKSTQHQTFSQDVTLLNAGKALNKDSKIRELRPFLDEDGLTCVGGRLQQSDFSFRQQHPWILPAKNRYCELLIQQNHENLMHAGVRDTLVQLRERYWIMRGRQLVKSVLSRCHVCRRFKAKPAQQITAPLPRDRITESPPFEVTGVDFAGPLYVKVSGALTKAYITLFTCAVTRAVHLELVSSQSTEHFLLALKRFIARRGLCKVIYSDNAKTFKRADQDMKELWRSIKDPQLLEYFSQRGISWRFIAERAAWWGGFWERLVRSVKTCLRKVLGRASLSFEELTTILTEVEATLNSRPLTFVNNDPDEPQPLTPAHFLVGKRLTSLPPKQLLAASGNNTTLNREEMTKRWRYRQRLMTSFWSSWRKDYLLDLKSAHRCDTLQPTLLKVGDIVLLGDDNMPRQTWKLGRVHELFPGRDGKVRSCAVRTASGTLLRRPVQLLYPLETE